MIATPNPGTDMMSTQPGFDFVAGGRTYKCHVEASRQVQSDSWWWFEVSGERYQRHAPFRAADTDTPLDVQTRVVAYYENLLERRAAPAVNRWTRRAPVVAAPVVVVAADEVEVEALSA
jgi:hypothetical protein